LRGKGRLLQTKGVRVCSKNYLLSEKMLLSLHFADKVFITRFFFSFLCRWAAFFFSPRLMLHTQSFFAALEPQATVNAFMYVTFVRQKNSLHEVSFEFELKKYINIKDINIICKYETV